MSDADRDLARRISEAAVEIQSRQNSYRGPNAFGHLKENLRLLPEDIREPVTMIILAGGAAMNQDNKTDERKDMEDQRRAKWGGIGIVVGFAAATLWPEPNRVQLAFFTIVVALSAGLVGSWIPGAFDLTRERPTSTIKTTGALGFAVLVLLLFFAVLWGLNLLG